MPAFPITIDDKPPPLIVKTPLHPLPPPPLTPKGYIPFVYPEPATIEVVPVIPDVIVIVGVATYPLP